MHRPAPVHRRRRLVPPFTTRRRRPTGAASVSSCGASRPPACGSVRPCVDQPDEREQRLGMRHRDARFARGRDDLAADRVDFGAAAREHVLQHRRAMAAMVADRMLDVACDALAVDRNALRARDGGRLGRDRQREPRPVLMMAELIDGATRRRAQRVERRVERDLLPDRGPHVGIERAGEPRARQRVGHGRRERACRAVGRHHADRAGAVRAHVRGPGRIGRPRRHADQDALERHERIQRLDVAEPVLQRQHERVRRQQRAHAVERGARVQRFGENDQQIERCVGRGGRGRIRGVRPHGLQRANAPFAAVVVDAQPVAADRIEMRIVHVDQRDGFAAFGQPRAEQRAHRAGAQNCNSHRRRPRQNG